ncbi:hypothetical protein B0H17DRAFT_1210819 [Mycena rosella]|uniref:RING-CH-type domain-containing protein n=1 Tax=Mycena rosella TaxID=1033263 RepID=A0AAD7CZA8_MYCRO|nr:hypothetical protein B0H17DRAFT_1210819 [Mycena rosella]
MDHIPTLDDLRVKSCFICLEEEYALASKSNDVWVHPCPNCALVAHDKCLLRWINSFPIKRRPKKGRSRTIFLPDAFKCPHCQRQYELADPHVPRGHSLAIIYHALYLIISELGDVVCSMVGLATLQSIPVALSVQSRLTVLSGMFIYELVLLKSYLGPRHVVFLLLRAITHPQRSMFDLLLTDKPSDLLRSLFIVVSTLPFRLLLPGTVPKWIIPLYLGFPPILYAMTDVGTLAPADNGPEVLYAARPMISTWPPSPALLGLVILPLLRPVYNRVFSSVRTWALGSSPPHRQKRYLTDRVKSVFTLGARRPPAPPPTIDVQDQDPPPIVIADQIIQKDQSSFTHDVLHALLTIGVPPVLGNLLYAVSGHSLYLRRFLGLRPLAPLAGGVHAYYPNWVAMSMQQRALAASQAVGGLLLGGSWIWADVDPVWWRNSLGYGIFVLVKDCFDLYRLWLQKGEVQSRTIKSRDFAGVDVRELDLVTPERYATRAVAVLDPLAAQTAAAPAKGPIPGRWCWAGVAKGY